jgi:hypothetical protein
MKESYTIMKATIVTPVNGEQVENEKSNARRYLCACCGQPINRIDWNNPEKVTCVYTPEQPVHGYHMHNECLIPHGNHDSINGIYRYHERMPDWFEATTGKATNKGKVAISLEPEGAPILHGLSFLQWCGMMWCLFGALATEDCTVTLELKFQTRCSFRGFTAMLNSLSYWLDMKPDCNGLHINSSDKQLTAVSVAKIAENRKELFGELIEEMLDKPEQVKTLFGRGFCAWANNPNIEGFFGHRTAFNLEHMESDKSARIEYRLNHFESAKQVFDACNFVSDCTNVLSTWAMGGRTTKSAARTLRKLFTLYATGNAPCQKRNMNI